MLGQRKTVILGGVLAAAVAAGGVPAFAESSACIFPARSNCSTKSVAANRSGHFVFVSITPTVHWIVRDAVNGVVVGSGTAGLLGTRRTIVGLFGRYVLEIDGLFSGQGTINNN